MALSFSLPQQQRAGAPASGKGNTGGRPRRLASGAVLALALLQLGIGVALLAVFESYKLYYFNELSPRWYGQHAKMRDDALADMQRQWQEHQLAAAAGRNNTTTAAALDMANNAPPDTLPPPEFFFGGNALPPPPPPPPPGDPRDWQSPMGVLFWLALASNVFAIAGAGGCLSGFESLVIAFFAYSAFAVVLLAHVFVDMVVESRIDYEGALSMPPPARGDGGGTSGGADEAASSLYGASGYEKAAAGLVFVQMTASALATLLSLRAADEVRRRRQYGLLSGGGVTGALASGLAFEPDA
jgi:hypothetical protein